MKRILIISGRYLVENPYREIPLKELFEEKGFEAKLFLPSRAVNAFGEIDNTPIIRGIKSGYNILVTPHVGGMTWQGQYRAWKWAIDKFKYNS